MEEMRPQFRYSFLAIKAVGISAIMATLMLQNMKGQGAVITLPHYDAPALKALWLFLFMGAIFGVLGFVFNKLVLACQDGYLALHQNKRHRFVAIGMLVRRLAPGFANAMEKFVEAGIPVHTLTNLPTLTQVAAEYGFIQPSELETVNRFAQNPSAWGDTL